MGPGNHDTYARLVIFRTLSLDGSHTIGGGMDARLRGFSKWVALVSIVVTAVVLASPAGADVTSSFRHLWREHIRPKLAKQGTFNAATNPVDWSRLKNVPIGNSGVINDPANAVDWTQLKNVPAGFTDGTDDVGAGGGGGGGQAPPAAPSGIVGLEVVRKTSLEDPKDSKGFAAFCPAGKTAIGGGAEIDGPGYPYASLFASQLTNASDGWYASAHEHRPTDLGWSIEVTAICAPTAP
jgi:hypothetical protein